MAVRILIADDNAPLRRALRRVLEAAAPWDILEAENGEDCLLKARDLRPNLIILDLAMPQMDGIRAARAISKILPDVPIIMHTLHYTPRVAIEALKAGVTKVVPKADRDTILSAIHELLAPKTPLIAADEATAVSPTIPEDSPVSPPSGPLSQPTAAEPQHKKKKPHSPGGTLPEG